MTNKTFIIAEIGTSHQGNIKKAKNLSKAASDAGADCIKFQWVYAHEILHPKTGYVNLPGGKVPLYDRFKQLEVSPKFFKDIQHYVRTLGKKFMCSPFGIQSLEELFAIKPDYIKIASPELNHTLLLDRLIELEMSVPKHKRVPIVISTGVSTLKDIERALAQLSPLVEQNLVSLLHCVTSYPAPVQEYNLELLTTYIKKFKIKVGVSDHSLDAVIVPVLSVACGGTIVEKHFTLSNTEDGLDDPVALEPKAFKHMVEKIRAYEYLSKKTVLEMLQCSFDDKLLLETLGTGKKELALSERQNYARTNRSIHYIHDMKKNDVITKDDIAILRTEKKLTVGIEPLFYEEVLGKTLKVDVQDGAGLEWDHLEKNA